MTENVNLQFGEMLVIIFCAVLCGYVWGRIHKRFYEKRRQKEILYTEKEMENIFENGLQEGILRYKHKNTFSRINKRFNHYLDFIIQDKNEKDISNGN